MFEIWNEENLLGDLGNDVVSAIFANRAQNMQIVQPRFGTAASTFKSPTTRQPFTLAAGSKTQTNKQISKQVKAINRGNKKQQPATDFYSTPSNFQTTASASAQRAQDYITAGSRIGWSGKILDFGLLTGADKQLADLRRKLTDAGFYNVNVWHNKGLTQDWLRPYGVLNLFVQANTQGAHNRIADVQGWINDLADAAFKPYKISRTPAHNNIVFVERAPDSSPLPATVAPSQPASSESNNSNYSILPSGGFSLDSLANMFGMSGTTLGLIGGLAFVSLIVIAKD